LIQEILVRRKIPQAFDQEASRYRKTSSNDQDAAYQLFANAHPALTVSGWPVYPAVSTLH
jgi:hypothetical protein